MRDLDVFLDAPKGASREELAAYLDEACGDDAALQERVEALLAADGGSGLMDSAPLGRERGARVAEGEVEGTMIGDYKLLHEIGKGGFGVVYMAEQLRPVKRRVALKVIKLGMDTKQVVARFEAERQALAMMDHPNIARVLDAGATESGRPYFVMDLVRGVPITTFCDENRMSVEERLALFIEVCGAVQHAHQKGVIHRDLKPSNVMVTLHDDRAVPKVIDFGVAKATQADLTDLTLYTRYDQFIGTPAYMSPEQAQMSGLDVDTRSDIYSLGVLLYELLTGVTPFDPKELAMSAQEEIRRKIREDEPPRPSTLLSTMGDEALTSLAIRLKVAPEKLRSELRGDLDWIIMKALEKDRKRRYDSATALAADIERHLADEPVTAAAPSAGYRIGKYVRRHRKALATAAVSVGVLLVGLVASLWQGVLLREANVEKDGALATAEAVQLQLKNDQVSDRIRLAEEFFAAGKADLGVAHLAYVLRREPENRVAAERLVSALVYRDFPRMVTPIRVPIEGMSLVRGGRFSDDGTEVLGGVRGANSIYRWDAVTGEREVLVEDAKHPFMAVAFSPDSRWIAAVLTFEAEHQDGLRGGSVVVWDGESREIVCEHELVSGLGVAFDPSGKRLVGWSELGEAKVWRVGDWEQVGKTMQHDLDKLYRDINMMDFSADGELLVSVSDEKVARVWRTDSGEEVCPPLPHTFYVFWADFSPDGKYVVTASCDHAAQVWSTQTGERVGRTIYHAARVNSAVFSPDGRVLVTASDDRTARLWDPITGEPLGPPLRHDDGVWRAVFDASGDRVLTASGGNARLWDVATGQAIGTALPGSGNVMDAAFSPTDDRRLFTRYLGDTSAVWESPADRPVSLVLRHGVNEWQSIWGGRVHGARFSGDGSRIVTGTTSAGCGVWDSGTGEMIGSVHYDTVGFGAHAVFDPSDARGRRVVTASRGPREGRDSGLFLWEIGEDGGWNPLRRYGGGQLRSIELSPDGRMVAGGAGTLSTRLWEAGSGKLICEVGSSNDLIARRALPRDFEVHFSPDGKRFVAPVSKNAIRVWRVPEGSPESPPLVHQGVITCAQFSPRDGAKVVTGSRDRTARTWDAETGDPLGEVMLHSDAVNSVEFNPEATTVLTASSDGTARIWDAEKGTPVGLPMHHGSSVSMAKFSPDGRRIATASFDGTARVWDAETGLPISEPLRHENWVMGVEFSPDGQRLVSCGDDGTARVWDLPVVELPVPAWFLTWAESVGGVKAVGGSGSEVVDWEDVREVEQAVRSREGDGFFETVASWYYADALERTITPFSEASVRQYVANEIASGEIQGFNAAARVAPEDPEALLALVRHLLYFPLVDRGGELWRAEFYVRQVLGRDPENADAAKLLENIRAMVEARRRRAGS